MLNKPHRTAIKRVKLALPMRELWQRGLLVGRCLDFGCGHGFDCDWLALKGIDFTGYDRFYRRTRPTGVFDTITAQYVLNTTPQAHEASILAEIRAWLKPGGTAYLTVRRDITRAQTVSECTYQRPVHLALPVFLEQSGFCTYRMT